MRQDDLENIMKIAEECRARLNEYIAQNMEWVKPIHGVQYWIKVDSSKIVEVYVKIENSEETEGVW